MQTPAECPEMQAHQNPTSSSNLLAPAAGLAERRRGRTGAVAEVPEGDGRGALHHGGRAAERSTSVQGRIRSCA